MDERKRRKDFIIERNLLYPNPLEKELSSEDKEVYERFKVFMRFLSPEDHANFLRNLVEERKLRNRIQDLQVRDYLVFTPSPLNIPLIVLFVEIHRLRDADLDRLISLVGTTNQYAEWANKIVA